MGNVNHEVRATNDIDINLPDFPTPEPGFDDTLLRMYTLGAFYSTVKQMDAVLSTWNDVCPNEDGEICGTSK